MRKLVDLRALCFNRIVNKVGKGKLLDLFLNKKTVVFQVVFGARNGGCSKNPRIRAWPNQKDHSGVIIG